MAESWLICEKGYQTKCVDCPIRDEKADPCEHAIEVSTVVRCPECKHHRDRGTHFCNLLWMNCPDDSEFFCKYGARMDGAE